MDRYDIGTAATFQINYVDESGNALTPTAVSYAVYDEVASQLVLTPPTASAFFCSSFIPSLPSFSNG